MRIPLCILCLSAGVLLCCAKPEDILGEDMGPPADALPTQSGDMGAACAATNTAENCGRCGNACPGLGAVTGQAVCEDPATGRCGLICRGENYDVDNQAQNGCERLRNSVAGHTTATATSRGRSSCDDTASKDGFSGEILSDARVHKEPAIDGFQANVGAAPDYYRIEADGGVCVNDYQVIAATHGGGPTRCYQFTIITNRTSNSITLSGADSSSMSGGSGSYSGGGTIYFRIEKICSLPVQEAVRYQVSYHL